MSYRIVSDGTPLGTKIYDDSGREVHHIVKAKWTIDAWNPAQVELVFISMPAEVKAKYIKLSRATFRERLRYAWKLLFGKREIKDETPFDVPD